MITFILLLVLLILAFVLLEMSLQSWLVAACVAMVVGIFSGAGVLGWIGLVVFAGLLALLFYAPGLRKKLLTGPMYAMVKKAMPPISETEELAINAGTVWWDAELFGGKPDWDMLMKQPKPELSKEELDFIEGPVEELCEMSDDWDITYKRNDLPPEVWQYIRDNKFFGLNASKDYGGLGFSAYGQSTIVMKLATRSGSMAVTVMVPNSLGPAELLYHYGTDEQKDYYLPRLSGGQEIPCFGLTGPWAGSDAAGMPDCGTVTMGMLEGKEVMGFRISWAKRYITLGPVSTLLGLAFMAQDPDGLLGGEVDLGITCALIPTDTDGVSIGRRHLPLNAAFMNGPNWGEDVFVPMEWIIGGEEQIGQGWRMLMESLAAGRGISLPASGVAMAKVAARTSGAYAVAREQFGISIGKFEGIEEALARIGGLTYLVDAGRLVITSALALGEKPAVMSGIVKQQCTDLSRLVVSDAMDVHGGKGICMGPGNYLARGYQQVPIAITVEGANILTRSLIIFGQGAMRCHPYLLKEVQAVNNENTEQGKADFDGLMAEHIQHVMRNKMRSFAFGLSRGRLAKGTGEGVIKKYSQQIDHLSASFSYLADTTLMILGGELKRKEMLSGRFADALSHLYLASSALKRFADNGEDEAEKPLVEWACQYSLYQVQQALDGILRNYPMKWLGVAMRVVVFPSGRYLRMPSDSLNQAVARVLQTPGAVRDRLTEDVYMPTDENDVIAQLEVAMALSLESEDLRKSLKKKDLEQPLDKTYVQWLVQLQDDNHISAEESELLSSTREWVEKVISVDDFPLDAGRVESA